MAGDARYTFRTLRKGLLVLSPSIMGSGARTSGPSPRPSSTGGRSVAAISISGPVKRFQDDNEALKRHVKKAGEEISAKLGHRA